MPMAMKTNSSANRMPVVTRATRRA
jgi:hypothetical protein